jgi:hypothetical protein
MAGHRGRTRIAPIGIPAWTGASAAAMNVAEVNGREAARQAKSDQVVYP